MPADFFTLLAPEHLLLALLLALMGLEMARAPARVGRALFVATLAVAAALLVWQWIDGVDRELVAGELRVDRYAVAARLVVVGCGLVLALAFASAETAKFWILVASSLLGAMVVVTSAGFVPLFLGIELLSLPAFALMVHGRPDASEGAFKYLLMSALATALLLFGVALNYGVDGTLSVDALARGFADGGAQAKAAGLLVVCGLFVKAAVFPFHGWAPDAYGGAALRTTALLASIVKGAVVFALVRIVGGVALDDATVAVLASLALVSIVYGNVAAIGQRRFKRLLAYSSIAHAGYMAFALADSTGQRTSDLLWYVAIYAATTIVACAAFAAVVTGDDDALDRVDGAWRRRPWAAAALALAMLSLAGVPPLPGFFAKLLVFRSVVASGHLVGATLAFVGSFIGLAYYASLAMRPFRDDRDDAAAATPLLR